MVLKQSGVGYVLLNVRFRTHGCRTSWAASSPSEKETIQEGQNKKITVLQQTAIYCGLLRKGDNSPI